MARIVVRDDRGERTVPLGRDEVVLGRGEGASISLEASGVSLRHARVSQVGSGYEIHDLESKNGLLLDGRPTTQHQLRHGDRLTVGEAELLFLEEEPEEGPAGAPHSQALLRAARRILAADLDVSRLLALVMDVLIVETGAARGFIVLQAGGGDLEFYAARNLEGQDLSSPALQLSRSVVRTVLDSGQALLVRDALEEQSLGGESVQLLGLRSVLAVPICSREQALIGVVYLDDPRRRGRFSTEHRELSSGLAELVAGPLENARELARAHEELRGRARLGAIVSRSPNMREVFDLVRRAATTRAPLLLVGESGTGKELVARAVHAESDWGAEPFLAVNVAAVSENLLESELFGHEPGAFTGAVKARQGLLREAGEGTIFLDELQEMSPGLQAKLLRVLQEGVVRPVGGDTVIPVRARVVAASSEDPLELVQAGILRDDLYYRLAVLILRLPPLRDRREDIALLVEQFLAREGGRTIEPAALGLLAAHSWPGNVRELENVVRELVIMCSAGSISAAQVKARLERDSVGTGPTEAEGLSLAEAKERFERQLISGALARAGGNLAAAGRELKVDRSQLHRVARRLGINPSAFRAD